MGRASLHLEAIIASRPPARRDAGSQIAKQHVDMGSASLHPEVRHVHCCGEMLKPGYQKNMRIWAVLVYTQKQSYRMIHSSDFVLWSGKLLNIKRVIELTKLRGECLCSRGLFFEH